MAGLHSIHQRRVSDHIIIVATYVQTWWDVYTNSSLHHWFCFCPVCTHGTVRNAHGSFAENQKLQLLRSTYQKAVATPLLGVENVWKEYNQFENVSTITCIHVQWNLSIADTIGAT